MTLAHTHHADLRRVRRGAAACVALLVGDYSAFLQGRVTEGIAARFRWAQLEALKRHAGAMAAANIFNAAILALALWETPLRGLSLVWGAAVAACVLSYVFSRWHGGRRPRARERGASAGTVRRAVRNSFCLGVVWGAMPVLMLDGAPAEARLIIACLCSGMMGGGAFVLATLPAAAIGMIAPLAIGVIVALAREEGVAAAPLVALIAVYCAILVMAVFSHSLDAMKRVVSRVEIERLSRRDGMTDLFNLAALREVLDQAALRMQSAGEACTLFCIDIVGMREINDRHGYAAGDQLLCQAADRLRGSIRSVDVAARLDGDQFAVLATGLSGEATARAYANRILSSFQAPFSLATGDAKASAVIGVAIARQSQAPAADLLRDANLAMHRAKQSGNDAVHVHAPRDGAGRHDRDALEIDLRKALGQGGLRIRYQPFLNVATGEISGFEALLRWPHPIRGSIPAPEIISIAEERGLIESLSLWVLKEACAAASAWRTELRVAVNISPLQLRSGVLLSQVKSVLAETGLAPGRLEIEITETALIQDQDLARHVLASLREAGAKLSLDDFGVGYSSLNYLRRLPFDRIKIDRAFLAEAQEDPAAAAIVRTIMALAKDLGMATTAEGVETQGQLDFLRELACDDAQGFLIAQPLAEDALAGFLEGWSRRQAA